MKRGSIDVQRVLELTKEMQRDINDIIQEGGDTMSENNRRSIYQVFAVNPKTAKIEVNEQVVAKDESEAILKAMVGKSIDIDKVDVGCAVLGPAGFIRPRKETQKVTIEKGEKEAVA